MNALSIMKVKKWYLGFSAVLIGLGIYSLVVNGLKLSIDFTGGSLLEVSGIEQSLEKETVEPFVKEISPETSVGSVQSVGEGRYSIRTSALNDDQKNQLLFKLLANNQEIQPLRFETVGPVLSKELMGKILAAALCAAAAIAIYVTLQFKELTFGVSAVLAMVHDSLILISAFSWLGYFFGVEVDVLFVTAVMTTLSFSVHDTIVVFDRIRELRRNNPSVEFESLVNTAVLQTLARSLNNSMTIIIMLLSLVLLGGDTIRWFAVALLIGAVTGTYSSTFTAVPLLLVWEEYKLKKATRSR